ncbi:DUF1858 domain-containing protein [Roseovarius spongiae]|uniref:DUF1858 domain-containing protein n=1 Tax=Roseovarius spongiae TaxID=2320272 RepID=A0A3A8AVA3_9RHOB|nr:DUF1858 domain-containing protein [Roseovarius spongiae]RKF16173.1 DUF1858 domain-containing protein [Roseovarius spongiae]
MRRRPRLDDPDLPIADLLRNWPQAVAVFMRHRMLCVGCLISSFHTVIDACDEYALDESEFRRELRQAVSASDAPRR